MQTVNSGNTEEQRKRKEKKGKRAVYFERKWCGWMWMCVFDVCMAVLFSSDDIII